MRVLTTLAAVVVASGCSNYGSTGTGSSDATLSNMFVSSGTMTPAFSTAVTAYAVTVPTATTQITVTATTASIYATLRVNSAIVPSGQASPAIGLEVGTNLITVAIIAEDGTPKTYLITVTRESAG